jgi:hypothetical protein
MNIGLYNDLDIKLLRDNADKIKNELEVVKMTMTEPSHGELIKAHEIIKNYCKEKKRKLYGGYALHLLLVNKNRSGLYKDTIVPDIDIYSPEPLDDLHHLCNILFNSGLKYIMGQEALHKETYTVKFYNETLCDFSYVPKNIYNRMPFIEIGGLYCIHPNFMTIDYLRIMSNPVDSLWKIFNNNEDLKALQRLKQLHEAYPLPFNDKNLKMNVVSPIVKPLLHEIHQFLLNKESTVTIGFYAYNYFCTNCNYDTINIPYYEFISINYKKDALELIAAMKKVNQEINCVEFFPFFQYTDYSVDIYLGDHLICRIYDNNKKCISYQDVKEGDNKIRIGSFSVVILHLLIGAQRARVNNDNQLEKDSYHVLSHCIQMRHEYFVKYQANYLLNTPFKDFVTNCIGEEVTSDKKMRIRIDRRKQQKKPLVHRYIPADEIKESPPKFIYNNTSGNKIVNPRNCRLCENTEDVDVEEE